MWVASKSNEEKFSRATGLRISPMLYAIAFSAQGVNFRIKSTSILKALNEIAYAHAVKQLDF